MPKPPASSHETARERVRITKTFVANPNLKPGFYVDSSDPGFGFRLKVTSKGKKVYLVYGKPKGCRNAITVTIGRHDEPKPKIGSDGLVVIGLDGKPKTDGKWTADKAESEAKAIWGLMRRGINPNEVREKATTTALAVRAKKEGQKKYKKLTLRKVFEDYLSRKSKKGKLRESTAYVYRCDVEKCLADWLDRPLTEITEKDIEARHDKISETHPGQANHVMRILRAVFNFAMEKIDDEYRTEDNQPVVLRNPVTHLSRQDQWNELKPRTHVLEDYQLKAFFDSCRWLNHPIASDYLQFLLLTGLRAEEAASLPWCQVDLNTKEIHIKETKNGKEHRLPLTDYLYALLKSRWQSRTTGYVFGYADRDGEHWMSDYRYQADKVESKATQLLAASDDENVQSKAESFGFMIHDLRRTFETTAALLLPQYVAKALVNHRDKGDVTQTHYVHLDVKKLQEPMRIMNDYILNCAGVTEYGAPAAPRAGKVVPLRGRKKASRV